MLSLIMHNIIKNSHDIVYLCLLSYIERSQASPVTGREAYIDVSKSLITCRHVRDVQRDGGRSCAHPCFEQTRVSIRGCSEAGPGSASCDGDSASGRGRDHGGIRARDLAVRQFDRGSESEARVDADIRLAVVRGWTGR